MHTSGCCRKCICHPLWPMAHASSLRVGLARLYSCQNSFDLAHLEKQLFWLELALLEKHLVEWLLLIFQMDRRCQILIIPLFSYSFIFITFFFLFLFISLSLLFFIPYLPFLLLFLIHSSPRLKKPSQLAGLDVRGLPCTISLRSALVARHPASATLFRTGPRHPSVPLSCATHHHALLH